jgi:hypothetical protein
MRANQGSTLTLSLPLTAAAAGGFASRFLDAG